MYFSQIQLALSIYFDSSFLNNVTDPAKRRDRTADTSIENGTV